jgi:hypothetical protein
MIDSHGDQFASARPRPVGRQMQQGQAVAAARKRQRQRRLDVDRQTRVQSRRDPGRQPVGAARAFGDQEQRASVPVRVATLFREAEADAA